MLSFNSLESWQNLGHIPLAKKTITLFWEDNFKNEGRKPETIYFA